MMLIVDVASGGAETVQLVRATWGVDLALAALIATLVWSCIPGTELPPLPSTSVAISQIFPLLPIATALSVNFVPPIEFQNLIELQSLEVEASVLAEPSVVEFVAYYSPGAILRCPPLGFDYAGWAVVKGANLEEAREKLQRVVDNVTFKYICL